MIQHTRLVQRQRASARIHTDREHRVAARNRAKGRSRRCHYAAVAILVEIHNRIARGEPRVHTHRGITIRHIANHIKTIGLNRSRALAIRAIGRRIVKQVSNTLRRILVNNIRIRRNRENAFELFPVFETVGSYLRHIVDDIDHDRTCAQDIAEFVFDAIVEAFRSFDRISGILKHIRIGEWRVESVGIRTSVRIEDKSTVGSVSGAYENESQRAGSPHHGDLTIRINFAWIALVAWIAVC